MRLKKEKAIIKDKAIISNSQFDSMDITVKNSSTKTKESTGYKGYNIIPQAIKPSTKQSLAVLSLNGRGVNSTDFSNKVENLQFISKDSNNRISISNISLKTTQEYSDLILNNKLIQNKNVLSKADYGILELSDLLTSTQLLKLKTLLKNKKLDLSTLTEFLETNFVSLGNKPLSLKDFIIYYNYSKTSNKNSKALLNNKYNLRHYLNLITDFNNKNNYYDIFQFKQTKQNIFLMEIANKLLTNFFLNMGCFISKPKFKLVNIRDNSVNSSEGNSSNLMLTGNTKTKLNIYLFYYVNNESEINSQNYLTENYDNLFKTLIESLNKLFNSEIELELVRLYQPFHDSNILAQKLNSLSYNSKFLRLTTYLFKKVKIIFNNNPAIYNPQVPTNLESYPSGISGLNIKLAGRAILERSVPRFTVKSRQKGQFDRNQTDRLDRSIIVDKSRKGVFTFTIRLAERFNRSRHTY